MSAPLPTQPAAFIGSPTGCPSALKVLYGLLTDLVPIYGYRRKSWLIIGWISFIALALGLSTFSTPSLSVVTAFMFFMSVSYTLSCLCTDCLIVERARYETKEHKGSFKVSGYQIKVFGQLLGAIMGTLLYNGESWGWGLTLSEIFILAALIPVTGALPATH